MTMIARSLSATNTTRIVSLVLALWLSAYGGAHAQAPAPFAKLAGQWSGSGTIDLSNGTHEPIKCRAAYDVLEPKTSLQLNIRCASESYNFDLRGTGRSRGRAVTGPRGRIAHK